MSERLKVELRRFISLSRRVGRDLLQAQAAGCNLSIKLDEQRMIIKSSGARLKDVSDQLGWTLMDYGRVMSGLREISAKFPPGNRREIAYADLLQAASLKASSRPSMEAGFHTILPDPYVFHVHSAAGILLGFLGVRQVAQRMNRRWPAPVRFRSVGSQLPGMELSWSIHGLKPVMAPRKAVTLWFLENHGLIWSSSDWNALQKAMAAFERHFQKEFQFQRYSFPHEAGSSKCLLKFPLSHRERVQGEGAHLCFCRWPRVSFDLRPLFPDMIIYFNLNAATRDVVKTSPRTALLRASTPEKLRDKAEVFYIHVLLSSLLPALRARAQRLDGDLIHRIKTLETERARMKIMSGTC
jgi:Class II Aldolase and Adducin N-terminal domain